MRRTSLLIAITVVAACMEKTSGLPEGFRSFELTTLAEGVTGTAALIEEAGATSSVTVTLRGVTAGNTYTGRIVTGSCANPGADAATLSTVTAQNTSALATTASVQDNVLTSGYALIYSRGGNAVACGNIP